MSTTVRSGQQRLAVTIPNWSARRRARRDGAAPAPAPQEFCAMCWGQGRLLTPARNGEGLIPTSCATCGGRGHRPATRR